MKHIITLITLLFSAQVFAGGSETRPVWSIGYEVRDLSISPDPVLTPTTPFENLFKDNAVKKPFKVNGIVINADENSGGIAWDFKIQSQDGEGGVESQPIPPKTNPKNPLFTGGTQTQETPKWLSLPAKGGSETVAIPNQQVALSAGLIKPIEIHSIRYVSETQDSVVLQINEEESFIQLKDAEVFKVENLKDMIGESVNNNSAWIKTH